MNLIVIEAHYFLLFFIIYLNEYLTINYVSAFFVHTNRKTRYYQVEEEIFPPWQGQRQVKGSKIKIWGFKFYTKDGMIKYLFRAVCPQK